MKLCIASQNRNKITEFQVFLSGNFELVLPVDFGITDELPETGNTLESNALQKARFIHQKFKVNCFADDSGLEVESLNNEPGVYSARYAGEQRNANDNMDLLLKKLENKSNRSACFKTVIALIIDNKEYIFEGKMEGEITRERRGNNGFGYDPIFVPHGFSKTFAEMNSDEKNAISHRAMAVKKLVNFLNKYAG
ncbi:MAG TPA: non-canonical purine NTP diphosphatase [Flavobacteriales bacterium]|nr:non-canonical purine NTP diphosphatase [Flavobacteriales bacterium]